MNPNPTIDTTEEHELEETGIETARLVPVNESIRYRRRAQSAEKKAEDLAEQLAQANQQITQMSQDVSELKLERQLTHKLAAAGAADIETALLVAKARMGDRADADLDQMVEQLKVEKGHLFSPPGERTLSRKTAGARDRIGRMPTSLERAAKKAARTGNRADLQEYLKLRRNHL